AARSRLLARLRNTALPTLRLAVMPNRAECCERALSGEGHTSRPSAGEDCLRPRWARRKSARVVMRFNAKWEAALLRPTVSCARAHGGARALAALSWSTCAS